MKRLFLMSLMIVSFSSKAQICNFCSEEELREALNGFKINFSEKSDIKGERYFTEKTADYLKVWRFKYGKCYMYEVTVTKGPRYKSMRKVLDSQYRKTSDNTWEDTENRVELKVDDESRHFVFLPKISTLQNHTEN